MNDKPKFNRSISRLDFGMKIKICDMHTCGMPVRIIESTNPQIPFLDTSTIQEKRRYLQAEMDHIRQMVILEPRGHKDMFGAVITDPNHNSDSNFGLIFLNNEGYGTMCGHATIGVSRYLLEKGLIPPNFAPIELQCPDSFLNLNSSNIPETLVKLDCPCGQIQVAVEFDGVTVGRSRFVNVPAFVQQFDCTIQVQQLYNASVKFDIAFGGNFYVIVDAQQLSVNFQTDSADKIVEKAMYLKRTVESQFKFFHPTDESLEHLFGVVVTQDEQYSNNDQQTNNVIKTLCVFGVNACDRSPCGSGSTAVLATRYFRNQIQLNQQIFTQNALLGSHLSQFTACALQQIPIQGRDGFQHQSILVEISGRANFIAESLMTYEYDDYFKYGFRL